MEGLFEQDAPPVVGYAQVALEQGIDVSATGLTYGVPQAMADLAVGERVVVPLGRGNKAVSGYVVTVTNEPGCDPKLVKPIIHREGGLSLTPDLIQLARWIAAYYVCPLGMVFASMLPAAVKRGTGTVTKTLVAPPDAPPTEEIKLTKLQRAVLDAAVAAGGPIELRQLADLAGAKTLSPIRQLVDKGLLVTSELQIVQSDLDLRAATADLPGKVIRLGPAQQAAVDHVSERLHQFGVHLLHGVTGSGKTEVYLRVMERLRGTGTEGQRHEGKEGTIENPGPSCLRASAPSCLPSTIVLVPEIALTPQTVARFVQRFGDVAVLHSGLTATQRHAQWRRIRSGEATVIIGARSAVFAPAPNLGLIIVDEEHESSYKQDQLPRYHARDVAIRRAQLLGIPVILGSATPSLESYANCSGSAEDKGVRSSPHWHLVRMPQRVAGMLLPKVRIVDLVEERKARRGVHLLSTALEQALAHTLKAKHQAMLLLNRRGYANYIACPDHTCGWMLTCDHCDVTMVYHRVVSGAAGGAQPGVVRCHHCSAEQMLPQACPMSGHKVTVFGLGTQRVESELHTKLPGARIRRMDSDTMRTGEDYRSALDAFRRGEIDILLGTQMIAKGLDFPNVTLVGVVSGDTALHLPDFRAAERTFQLIAQVAGRAGRSDKPGQVIVQSWNPEDPVILLASEHDYDGFAQRELTIRTEVGLPPATRMTRIVVRDTDHVACAKRVTEIAQVLRQLNEQLEATVRIRGPVPCAVARIADYHRQQIELIAPTAAAMQKLLTAARNAKVLISDAHVAVDVDPVSLL